VLSLLINDLSSARLAGMTETRTASQTARQRARAELTREIKAAARRQVADAGPQRLSLRAVARELGLASSALYRYFPSRDELLTALIIDAYDALGERAERAAAAVPRADTRGRWLACCAAVRAWAVAHPHEYALIYGSPVPGYLAPQETIPPATRVAAVLGELLTDAWTASAPAGAAAAPAIRPGPALDGSEPAPALPDPLGQQAAAVAAAIAPGVPEPMIVRGLIAFTQLFGMLSFELFGQLVGSADPADTFFSYAVDQMADFVGLSDARSREDAR
jgi:AcrR family transcriptional regulator